MFLAAWLPLLLMFPLLLFFLFPLIIAIKLNFLSAVSKAKILEGPTLYLSSGSTLNLTCLVRDTPEPPDFIFWYFNGRVSVYVLVLPSPLSSVISLLSTTTAIRLNLPSYNRLASLYFYFQEVPRFFFCQERTSAMDRHKVIIIVKIKIESPSHHQQQ